MFGPKPELQIVLLKNILRLFRDNPSTFLRPPQRFYVLVQNLTFNYSVDCVAKDKFLRISTRNYLFLENLICDGK